MTETLSPRLRAIADALPLRPGLRVLEIGSGTGALARELVRRGCDVVAIDRSERAHAIAVRAGGGPDFRCLAVEDFALADGEARFDLVVAVRVGPLDGRHAAGPALARIAAALAPGGRVLVQRAGTMDEMVLPGSPSRATGPDPRSATSRVEPLDRGCRA